MQPNQWPAIFYSPHQDDEAIGMAGAIQQHIDAGRPVFLVLLTNGFNSPSLFELLNGVTLCPWHGKKHDYKLTNEELMWSRKAEFIASGIKLGVDKIFIVDDAQGLNDPEGWDIHTPHAHTDFVDKIANIIFGFEKKFPGASHKLVSGYFDVTDPEHKDSADPRQKWNLTHLACWEAAESLRNLISDFRFYRIYIYRFAESVRKTYTERPYKEEISLKPDWLVRKHQALAQYKVFEPDIGRYGIGYHSVGPLIDAAFSDTKEYVDELP